VRAGRAAFTLIEVLAAVFLTAITMTVALAFFVNLSDSTDAAAQKARQGRLALAVLDRIARDLEGAYLLAKPEALDPLLHPWVFLAESHELDSGSDRLRFVTRSHRPANPHDHGSDLAVVTYLLHPAADAPGFDLLRAISPGLPEELDREFPPADDERFMIVAEHIDHFAVRFLGEELEWVDDWDSSQLERSGQLPRAADIEIAYLPLGADDEVVESFEEFGDLDPEEEGPPIYARRVRLPLRPVDLASLLQSVDAEAAEQATTDDEADEGEGDEEGDEDAGEDAEDDMESQLGELPEGFDPGRLEPPGASP
jgi:hypothetical protein